MLYEILPYTSALFFVGVLVYLWRTPKPVAQYGRDDGQADVQPDPYRAIADDVRAHQSRQGRDDFPRYPQDRRDYKPGDRMRYPGKSPVLAAPFGKRTVPPVKKPVVVLTPRMIERINIERRHSGRPPLNRAGIKNAIAGAWDTPRREPSTTNDWLTYLVLYEVFLSDHQQPHVSGTGGFTIDPDLPYNGQGGEFAGAGASGDWSNDPITAAKIADGDYGRGGGYLGVAAGVAAVEYDRAPSSVNPDPPSTSNYTSDPPASTPSYKSDTTPSYSAPDPTPSYSALVSDPSAPSGDGS